MMPMLFVNPNALFLLLILFRWNPFLIPRRSVLIPPGRLVPLCWCWLCCGLFAVGIINCPGVFKCPDQALMIRGFSQPCARNTKWSGKKWFWSLIEFLNLFDSILFWTLMIVSTRKKTIERVWKYLISVTHILIHLRQKGGTGWSQFQVHFSTWRLQLLRLMNH